MAYRNKTYVIFDGDDDIWAYGRMKGWKALPTVDFDFYDAHDLGSELTDRASEETVKSRLRSRFSSAKQVVVLVGAHTRYLFRFVRWELDIALELDLPMIAVNLNGKRRMDNDRCPPIIRPEYVVHVPFKRAIIKYALDNFPREYTARIPGAYGPRYYPESVYEELGLNAPAPPKVPTAPPGLTPPPPVNYLANLLSRTPPPPALPFGLRDLAGLASPPEPPSPLRDLPIPFWPKNRLK
jgi:hypothetical protein